MTSSPFFSRRKTEDYLNTMLFILIQATGYSNDTHFLAKYNFYTTTLQIRPELSEK